MKSVMSQLKNALSFVLGAMYALVARHAIAIVPREEWSFADVMLVTMAIVGGFYLTILVIVFFFKHWDD